MALTKSQLQQIIREETSRTLQEQQNHQYSDPARYANHVLSRMSDKELENAARDPISARTPIEEILLDMDMYHGDAERIARDLSDSFSEGGVYRKTLERRTKEVDELKEAILDALDEYDLTGILEDPNGSYPIQVISQYFVEDTTVPIRYTYDPDESAREFHNLLLKDGSYKERLEKIKSEDDGDYDDEDLNEASLGDFMSGVGRTFRSGGLPGSARYVEEKLADYKEHFAGSDMWSEIKGLLETYGDDLRNFLLGRILVISKTGVDEGIKIPEKFGGKRFTMYLPEDVDGEETDIRLYAKAMYDAIYGTGGYISRRHRRAEDLGKARERERLGLDEGRRALHEGSSPAAVFNKIKDICEEALSNKSLGMRPAVAERLAGRIRDALKDLD